MMDQVQTPQRTRQRMPYRDDPSAAPSVRLESFTAGGLGPLPQHNATSFISDQYEKTKNLPLARKVWNTMDEFCCRPCCVSVATASSNSKTNNDPNLYYEDTFNDLSWSCSIGTSDEDGVWLNQGDPAGTIMAVLVWVLMGYSALTMTLLAAYGGIPPFLAMLYTTLASLCLASHVKTSLTDPGAVPAAAVPTEAQRLSQKKLSMCSQCQTFKPPFSHHCRICNRCISRMDHHCPWMNNCVGAGNLKHFLLFLIYTWACSVFSLILLGYNYFFCADEGCVFNLVLTQLVRIMTILSVGAFLFTSSMLMNVVYGIMTGVGTIDRLKKKATGTMSDADEESIPLTDVFGIGPLYQWPLPIDPLFDDYDRVMGYATPQRLLREQMRVGQQHQQQHGKMMGVAGGPAVASSVVGMASSVVSRDSYMPV